MLEESFLKDLAQWNQLGTGKGALSEPLEAGQRTLSDLHEPIKGMGRAVLTLLLKKGG